MGFCRVWVRAGERDADGSRGTAACAVRGKFGRREGRSAVGAAGGGREVAKSDRSGIFHEP